ncbi:MAG: response regulator transcription factor [Armatimonadota bacterium]
MAQPNSTEVTGAAFGQSDLGRDTDSILVISADGSFAHPACTKLRRNGAHVVRFSSAHEGLGALDEESHDLAIIDLDIGGMPGVDLCRKARDRSMIPIIVVRGADGDDLEPAMALEMGADSFHQKPIAPGHLVALTKAFLRRTRSARARSASTRLRVGPLVLDVETREAWLAGDRLQLAPKESAVLAALAERPGRIVSREALARRVWRDDIMRPQLLGSHLSRLRRKLAANGEGRILIVTVPRIGYALYSPGD